ncbi:MAG: hypothetical protein H6707_05065 [Deltaproteobacteria bacterium]|nr:hypothetical protein [Deltaproteobacteria bacterium]
MKAAHLLVLLAIGFWVNACGSQGCAGCQTEPIPGGFPAALRIDNAMQVRASQQAFGFLESKFPDLVAAACTQFPCPITVNSDGSIGIEIPKQGCGTSTEICCGTNDNCSGKITFDTVKIDPVAPNRVVAEVRFKVAAKIKVRQQLGFWISCDADYKTDRSGISTVRATVAIDAYPDPNDQNRLKIVRHDTSLGDFECADLKFDIVCGIGCLIFRGELEKQVKQAANDAIDAIIQQLPTGDEGRVDLATLMSDFVRRAPEKLDYLTAAGGYSQAENFGFSVGGMVGARAAARSGCAPDCESPGASCRPPTRAAIPRSNALRGNTRPDGKEFHVGIGVHRQALEHAGYAAYRAGALCLDVDNTFVPQLTSDFIGLLIPSLKTLTEGASVPIRISVRPQQPPTIKLGKGKTHKDTSGNIVIDEPLLTVRFDDFNLDVYAQVHERFIRLMTVAGALEVPMVITSDANGNLLPVLGDLEKALVGARVINNELLTENAQDLADVFPMLLGIAAGFVGSSLQAIELPTLAGIKLELDDGSLTSLDNDQLLGVFAKLAIAPPPTNPTPNTPSPELPFGGAAAGAAWQPTLARLELPTTRRFAVGQRGTIAPTAWIDVSGLAIDGTPASELEFTYRVDGGFLNTFRAAPTEQLAVRSPLLWLQGPHRLEIRARVADRPETLTEPHVLMVTVDTQAPSGSARAIPGAVLVEASDAITPTAALQVSVRRQGALGFDDYRVLPEGGMLPADAVAIRLRDQSGNVRQLAVRGALPSSAEASEAADQAGLAGGCALGGLPAAGANVALLLLGLGLCLRRRRS